MVRRKYLNIKHISPQFLQLQELLLSWDGMKHPEAKKYGDLSKIKYDGSGEPSLIGKSFIARFLGWFVPKNESAILNLK